MKSSGFSGEEGDTLATSRETDLVREDGCDKRERGREREARNVRGRRRQMDSTDLGRERTQPNDPTCSGLRICGHVCVAAPTTKSAGGRDQKSPLRESGNGGYVPGRLTAARRIRILASRTGDDDVRRRRYVPIGDIGRERKLVEILIRDCENAAGTLSRAASSPPGNIRPRKKRKSATRSNAWLRQAVVLPIVAVTYRRIVSPEFVGHGKPIDFFLGRTSG